MTDAKKVMSKVGLGLAAMFGISWIYIYFIAPHLNIPEWTGMLIPSAIMYGIGMPILMLILGKTPNRITPEKKGLPPKQFLLCIALQFTALLFTTIMIIARTIIMGPPSDQVVLDLTASNLFILLIFNPIAEEFVFRKLLADKLRPYGDKLFIFVSAFCFAIVHGVALGIPQVVYTFILGLVWAYVLVKTGNILYPIILHALSNLLANTVPQLLGDFAGIYTIITLLIGAAGLVIYLVNRKKTNIDDSTGVINIRDTQHMVTSWGLVFYFLLTVSMYVIKAALL